MKKYFLISFIILTNFFSAPTAASFSEKNSLVDEATTEDAKKRGAMLICGFKGTKVDDDEVKEVISLLSKGLLGGVILLAHNIETPAQLNALTTALYQANPRAFIWADEEGGRVRRLTAARGFNEIPWAKEIGDTKTKEEAFEIYKKHGLQLKSYGIDTLAPIADLHSDQSSAIGMLNRAYSNDPSVVTKFLEAAIKGYHAAGVLTCLKHVPGHGLVSADSHEGITDGTATANIKDEMEPYYTLRTQTDNKGRPLIDAIMSAHVMNTEFDPKYPATLSPIILKTLLRDEGYDGVIITDDLFMKAIKKNFGLEESIKLSVEAGNDLLLFAALKDNKGTPVPTIVQETLLQKISMDRINESYKRLEALKDKKESFKAAV